ncbi:MAG: glycosyltransferase [Candidatus Hodarchaeota archaeon]
MPKELKRVIKLSESKYFKGIITIYRILKKLHAIEGVPEKKINILDCSVDLNEFDSVNYKKAELRKHLYLPLDKKILLYSGKLTDERGIDTYIEASRTLDNKKYEFCFLGGNKKEIKLWNKYIKKKRISGDFRFLGSKNYNLVKYYLKSADLLLALFSSKCRTIKWMSPLKIFEYMASKVPFIASNAFRLHEICNNNECLFYNIDDSRDLSEKIKLLIENMDLRENLIQNAYTKVKNYGYKKRCEKILELI